MPRVRSGGSKHRVAEWPQGVRGAGCAGAALPRRLCHICGSGARVCTLPWARGARSAADAMRGSEEAVRLSPGDALCLAAEEELQLLPLARERRAGLPVGQWNGLFGAQLYQAAKRETICIGATPAPPKLSQSVSHSRSHMVCQVM